MLLKRDAGIERHILDSCKTSFSTPRTGIHLSDLLKPRQAYWQRVMPMPLTDSEVQYFLAGRGHEDALGRVAGLVITPESEADGISFRPDFTFDIGAVPEHADIPGEMKTRRANLAKPGEEPIVYKSYLDQLRGYCALKNSPRGVLVVFSLLEGRSGDPLNPTHPELACYAVQFTEAELAQTRARLQMLRGDLEQALETGDHTPLPLCEKWMCGRDVKTVTTRGGCDTCGPLNEPWLSKHTQTKSGAGHIVTPETAEWKFTPRCKWFYACEPHLVDPTRQSR